MAEPSTEQPIKKWPIVYHPQYNVKLFGLEKLHPFDSSKWANIKHFLETALMANRIEFAVYEATEVSEDELLTVHPKSYLKSLKSSIRVAAIAEVPIIALIPNPLVQKHYLKPMRFQVGGSILAGILAIEKGWAVNIGGGFHHCSRNKGQGFCPYADITLLISHLFANFSSVRKAMIVDLDAHQGNGHEIDFAFDERVFIMDVYNGDIYPNDAVAKAAINCKLELKSYTCDGDYLHMVENYLEKSLSKFHPDILVYNAGTDILDGDPLGKLCISAQGIMNRDQIVFMKARERRIPIVMLTSGGYLKKTAKIISDSLLNLSALNLISPN